MVISLTIIPVLAARYLGRRPMPDDRPDLQPAGRSLRGAAQGRARVSRATVCCWPLLAVDSRLVAVQARWRRASCPTWTRGPSSSITTCRSARRWPRPTRCCGGSRRCSPKRPTSPATSAGPGPSSASSPPRPTPATSWSASSPRASGGRRRRSSTACARSWKTRSPSWRPSCPAGAGPDQRPGGRRHPRSRSRSSAPTSATLRSLAEEVGKVVEEVHGAADVNAHVFLGNPDIVVRPDSVQTARVGLTVMDVEAQLNAALYGQVASTVPEQDRMTKIRVRYPDRVRYDHERLAMLPISLATATPRRRRAARAGGGRRDRLRPARATRDDPNRPQPQRAVAREPAAGDHRHRRAGRPRPGLGQPRAASEALPS